VRIKFKDNCCSGLTLTELEVYLGAKYVTPSYKTAELVWSKWYEVECIGNLTQSHWEGYVPDPPSDLYDSWKPFYSSYGNSIKIRTPQSQGLDEEDFIDQLEVYGGSIYDLYSRSKF